MRRARAIAQQADKFLTDTAEDGLTSIVNWAETFLVEMASECWSCWCRDGSELVVVKDIEAVSFKEAKVAEKFHAFVARLPCVTAASTAHFDFLFYNRAFVDAFLSIVSMK